jgi:hypothetical protein
MNNNFRFFPGAIALFGLLLLSACVKDKDSWVEHDLIEYGVSLKIMAPDSIEVEKSDFAGQKDVTVKAGEDYNLQLFISDATQVDMNGIISGLRKNVESNRYFDGMVQTYKDGFIYKLTIDSTHQYYGFRRVFIKGDKEYVVQNNLLGVKSEEHARKLYDSVE